MLGMYGALPGADEPGIVPATIIKLHVDINYLIKTKSEKYVRQNLLSYCN